MPLHFRLSIHQKTLGAGPLTRLPAQALKTAHQTIYK
jgi:hypothetical protein